MFVHRSYFEAGGDLEHFSFLFLEELYVGETCERLDLEVLYEPALRFAHGRHRSIGRVRNRAAVELERAALQAALKRRSTERQ